MNKEQTKFINDTTREMEQAGVTVFFDLENPMVMYTDGGMPCNGYFSDESRIHLPALWANP